jgi:hypothetical protein
MTKTMVMKGNMNVRIITTIIIIIIIINNHTIVNSFNSW